MQAVLIGNRKGGVGKTMLATTLAAALANRGGSVALADADRQHSSLGWLARRPAWAAPIRGLDWQKSGAIGDVPKGIDWLVIDAPGALKGGRAEALIAEARAVIAPVQPSVFDAESTASFIAEIEEIKRVRKGKVPVHVIANRLRAGTRAAAELDAFLKELGREAVAHISDRAIYGQLARDGLAIFDRSTRGMEPVKAQWRSVLAVLDA